MPYAETLLLNGRLLTNAPRPASALAVLGHRIIAVGGDDEILALRGPRTRVIDLRGRFAVPGFTDSHVHLAALSLGLSQVRLEDAATLEQALRRIGARARKTPPGRWIRGRGFDKNRWGDDFPTRHELDRVAPNHPVALHSRDGHSLWVNSLALRRCRITAKAKAPRGGVIVQDRRGQPTGILQEAATSLIYSSPCFDEPRSEADDLSAGLRVLLKQGITSVHLMEEAPLFDQLQALRAEGGLRQRVTLYLSLASLDDLIDAGVHSGFGDEWLRLGGVKLFMDGALGGQTAWLFEPYDNKPSGYRGVTAMPPKELRRHVRRAAEAGLACAIHAIGDRAVAEAIGALAAVREHRTPLPHRVEHVQLVRPEEIRRFSELGLVASMQPCHILGDIQPAERYWGRRCRYAYPVASLLKSGATLAFGSDAPVQIANPLAGIYAAVARQTLDGQPKGGWHRAREGIGVVAALRAYTVGPAVATGESHFKGRLAPGYLADIAVLSKDIRRLRGQALLTTRVDMVIVGEKVRYAWAPRG